MTRSTPNAPLRLLARAATAGLVIGLLDAIVARFQRAGGDFSLGLQWEAFAGAAWILAGTYLAASILLHVAGRLVGKPPRSGALGCAVTAGLVVAVGDAGLFRFDSALASLGALRSSAALGALACAATYLAITRRHASSAEGTSDSTNGGSSRVLPVAALLAFAAVTLSPRFMDAAMTPANTTPRSHPVTGDHAVKRVIMIVVDTLRADALSCQSSTGPTTPTMDALAAEGHRFGNARAPAAWTLPSMVSIMTGVTPLVHGAFQRNSQLPDALPTLAEHMSEAGYRTGAIGHNLVLSPVRRLNRGFDDYIFHSRGALPARSFGFLLLARAYNRDHAHDDDAATINQLAYAWLDDNSDQDFFLWLHYYDPHVELKPGPEYQPEMTRPAGARLEFGHDDLSRVRGGYQVPDRDEQRWIRALYDGEVRYFDDRLGELFAKLKEMGLYDESLIILTADHGEEFWEHNGVEHGHTLYEEVVRVPLIIKLPGQREGSVHGQPVSLESLLPTVLSTCDIQFDETLLSGASLLDSGLAAHDAPLTSTGNLYYQNRISVLFDGWKYIRLMISGDEELYNLTQDPNEEVSLVALDPPQLARGRQLCDEQIEAAAALREKNGVHGESSAELSDAERAGMAAIGYASGDDDED